MVWFALICGIYSIMLSAFCNTKNLQSTIVFRAIPAILGIGCVMFALKEMSVL